VAEENELSDDMDFDRTMEFMAHIAEAADALRTAAAAG